MSNVSITIALCSFIVITSLGKEGAGRFAGPLLVCQRSVVLSQCFI